MGCGERQSWPRVGQAGLDRSAMSPLLLLTCKLSSCQRRFLVCSPCYRGHNYCTDGCAQAGRAESVKQARAKYARSDKGLRNHRERSRRHYIKKTRQKSLTDPSSRPPVDVGRLAHRTAPKRSASARPTHVDELTIPKPSLSNGDDGTPRLSCVWCGRVGTHVLRSKRFHR